MEKGVLWKMTAGIGYNEGNICKKCGGKIKDKLDRESCWCGVKIKHIKKG